jgi:AraC-like DNA-binding protein
VFAEQQRRNTAAKRRRPNGNSKWNSLTGSSPTRHAAVTICGNDAGVKPLTHLSINEANLAPGAEWRDFAPGWKIVLISKGFLYWVARSEARQLQSGDVLAIGTMVDGTLRASQIGPASFHFFYFRPEHLVGLMSLSDRLSLEAFAQTAQTRIIPASDPISREFTDIVSSISNRRSFFYRCHVLHLIAMIFGDALPGTPPPKNHVATTLLRFEEIISRIPDTDLINYSSEKLAEMCGCSLRHFRRMFRRQFKTSIRAKQTELRLEKARQLLAETDEKITTVANESGYRHLGLFNSMFKKRFGMTPREWRQLNAPPEEEKRPVRRHR